MKKQKKFKKRWVFIAFILLVLLGSCGDDAETTEKLQESEELPIVEVDETEPLIFCSVDEFVLNEDEDISSYALCFTAEDETDGELSNEIIIDDSDVVYGEPGEYEIRVSVKDNSGNESTKSYKVSILDSIAPVIALAKNNFSLTEGDGIPDYADIVTVSDNIDEDLTRNIEIDDSNVDYDEPGTYEVIYRVTDSSGNSTTEKATVEVKAKEVETVPAKSYEEESDDSSVTVLITKTGECYHLRECGRGNYFWVTLDEALNRGLRACQKCY